MNKIKDRQQAAAKLNRGLFMVDDTTALVVTAWRKEKRSEVERRIKMVGSSLPHWIEVEDLSQVTVPCTVVTDEINEMATMTGLKVERFTLVAQLGGPGIVLEPRHEELMLCPLAPARTFTLLALVRAYFDFPVLVSEQVVMPHGGFSTADWLAAKIEHLTKDTRFVFSPPPSDVRVAVRRLKNALGRIVGRFDLIESKHGLGYRFRVWPSLITVIICNRPVTEM